MRDGTKDAQVNFRCEPELRDRAKTHPDLSQSAVWRTGARAVLDGDAIADAEYVNECVYDVMGIYESVLCSIEEEYDDVGLAIDDEIREARRSAAHEVMRRCFERVEGAESEVDRLASDPEARSPGYEKSPMEAAETLVEEHDGTVFDAGLIEGPENAGVQTQAEKCGMDPEPFFEFLCEKLDESELEISAKYATRYDERESTASEAVATDGGSQR